MASALRVQVSPSALFHYKLNSISPVLSKDPDLIVVIISNGPGELSTWVKPVAKKLDEELKINPFTKDKKISLRLALVPCPNATGKEYQVAQQWDCFEKIYQAKYFWKLLINPKKFSFWPSKGIVLFLGGDQFWNVLLSARLNYKSITYAEWIARWPFWNDLIAAMSPKVKKLIPKKYQSRCKIVGDLMADIEINSKNNNPLPEGKWIALLPGSKKAKLIVGIPFFLEMVDHLSGINPKINFILPIAPTTNIKDFYKYNSSKNPIANCYNSGILEIKDSNLFPYCKELTTKKGTKILLIEKNPAHEFLSQCTLAITTVGANTAELGALTIPMIVIIPTQHILVMEAWDGFLGIIGRLPGLKWCLGLIISLWKIKKNKFFAWPNITASRMIVPERIGKITPQEIAKEANGWIVSKEKLIRQKEDLKALRGKPGAVNAICKEIAELIRKY